MDGPPGVPRSSLDLQESRSLMGKIVKVTDLTKLEGDPDPRRANIPDPRLELELHASGPLQSGFLKFVARCSERAPVARAVVVALLLVVGLALAGVADVVLAGIAPDWVRASVPLVLVFVPFPLYWIVTRWDRRP
jgi:hypothetical protein